MKKYFSQILGVGELPTRYMLASLKLIFITAAMLMLYYITLDSLDKNALGYAEFLLFRKCTEYIIGSVSICLSCGLCLDIYMKKNRKN